MTEAVVEAIDESDFLRFDAIGEVVAQGLPEADLSLYQPGRRWSS